MITKYLSPHTNCKFALKIFYFDCMYIFKGIMNTYKEYIMENNYPSQFNIGLWFGLKILGTLILIFLFKCA